MTPWTYEIAYPISRAMLASMTVQDRDALRSMLRDMDRCEHVCYHGPGHQSHSECEARGIHDEHHVDTGSGYHTWTDEDERETTRTVILRDENRNIIRGDDGLMKSSEPFKAMVYFADYWG